MKESRTLERISTTLVLLWIIPGVGLLYILGGMILGKSDFHLGLGLINTVGRSGLLFTVVPALLGTAAVLLLFRMRALGARLLTIYCAFWFLNFLGGLIHNWDDIVMSGGIFNGPVGMRIGVGLMIVLFLGSFLLCGLWGWRRSWG
jgi:hypothetical protein